MNLNLKNQKVEGKKLMLLCIFLSYCMPFYLNFVDADFVIIDSFTSSLKVISLFIDFYVIPWTF